MKSCKQLQTSNFKFLRSLCDNSTGFSNPILLFFQSYKQIILINGVALVHTRTRRTSSIQVSTMWIPGIQINQVTKPVPPKYRKLNEHIQKKKKNSYHELSNNKVQVKKLFNTSPVATISIPIVQGIAAIKPSWNSTSYGKVHNVNFMTFAGLVSA